ncbi:MAG: hypothetical protein EOO43_05450 [Flavobacterium sp.]|nr:MAG: hypothetical protein EOO43_05450 [Flavobacterium sp.]
MGVIHRDLKPANILISGNYGKYTSLITDFGISKVLKRKEFFEPHSEGISTTVGTIQYKSPEQLTYNAKYNNSLDLWAFGVMLFKILTNGSYPFYSEIRQDNSDSSSRDIENQILHKKLDEVFVQFSSQHPKYQKMLQLCLVRDYKQRVQSARELIRILDDIKPITNEQPTDFTEPEILYFTLSSAEVNKGEEVRAQWKIKGKPHTILLVSEELNIIEKIGENQGYNNIKVNRPASLRLEIFYKQGQKENGNRESWGH